MQRAHQRLPGQMRNIRFVPGYAKHALGSCWVEFGDTHVLCTASLEDRVPPFLRGTHTGWLTAEYGMLPCSTHTRGDREAARGKQSGRTVEIQRLIGRSLRTIVNLQVLGEQQIKIDCDVIQADGGTRTASISGAYIALYQALYQKKLHHTVLTDSIAAISCGICHQFPIIDLDYQEDSQAQVDANFVMTGRGRWVEIQCSAEGATFTPDQFQSMTTLATQGLQQIQSQQQQAIQAIKETL